MIHVEPMDVTAAEPLYDLRPIVLAFDDPPRRARLPRWANLPRQIAELALHVMDACRVSGRSLSGTPVPAIKNIHAKVFEAASVPGVLNMCLYHGRIGSQPTHCRAGLVVELAGEAGRKLEMDVGTLAAARMIYTQSDPRFVPDIDAFAAQPNSIALADMERCAKREARRWF